MRIAAPFFLLRTVCSRRSLVRHFQLMIFAIEVGFIDRERIDELRDLAPYIGAQPREIAFANEAESVADMRSSTRRAT